MELSLLMRFRIAAAMITGAILIGVLGWSTAKPATTFGAVSLSAGSITSGGSICLVVLAFLAGFIGYFLSWPYGREIGILAAPSGLAVLALRTGSMAGLMQLNPNLAQYQALLAALKWEPVFWLAVVAAGFAGVLSGQKILSKPELNEVPAPKDRGGGQEKSNPKPKIYLNAIIGLAGSILIVQFLIGLLAQDVKIFDPKLGHVVGQPEVGQIAFAVMVSFGFAAFIVKVFLNISYIWPIIASALVTAFTITFYVQQDALQYLIEHQPRAFFSNAVISILPVQMVAFGTLGAIAGYWLAIRYNFWRKHEK
jgi:hypothetical protein